MESAVASSVGLVAYLTLFAGVGVLFVFANLLIGKFLRPSDPHVEKREIYECGEPTIGSSFVQFDLRFYVVALVFIIFEVEVAFLFPWATVFGKAVNLMNLTKEPSLVLYTTTDGAARLTRDAGGIYRELGVRNPTLMGADAGVSIGVGEIASTAGQLAGLALWAAMFFFVVLLIGFAYEWKTGALDWVRAVARERGLTARGAASPPSVPASAEEEPALSA